MSWPLDLNILKNVSKMMGLDLDMLKHLGKMTGLDQTLTEGFSDTRNLLSHGNPELQFENFAKQSSSYEVESELQTGDMAPKMNPTTLRFNWSDRYKRYKVLLKNEGKQATIDIITSSPNTAYVSVAPLASLKRTSILDLKINIRATGFYLLLRTIELPTEEVGICTIVEDDVGNVYTFAAFNMTDPDLGLLPEEVFPLGTIFILKEPFLKLSLKGGHLIRCDSPSDIVMVHKKHTLYELVNNIKWQNSISKPALEPEPQTAVEWKDLGNIFFQRKLYSNAIEAYFMTLDRIGKEEVDLRKIVYLNMAATFLKWGHFEKTIIYAAKVLHMDPKNEKALYRAGCAHYELRKYEDANQQFIKLNTINPKLIEGEIMLRKCEERLNEEKGNFDIYKLYLTSTLKPKTRIECADFMGPLKVVKVPVKGRCYVATRDIEPGTLLLVSKALEVSFYRDREFPIQMQSSVDISKYDDKASLVSKVAQAIIKNPLTNGDMILDLKSNVGNLDDTGKLFCDELKKEEVICDIARIRGIVETNCFGVSSPEHHVFQSSYLLQQGSGLFIKASYFNHSCVSNANWATYNDVLVVFSTKPIRREEEVYISYFSVFDSYCERKLKCVLRKFQCVCSVCTVECSESETLTRERYAILEEFVSLSSELSIPGPVFINTVKKMKADLKRLEHTYKNYDSSSLKVTLVIAYMKLALALFKNGLFHEAMEALDKGLRSIGLNCKTLLRFADGIAPFPENSLVTFVLCQITKVPINGYDSIGQPEEAKRWLRVLINLEKMFSGGNVQVVKSQCKNLPAHLF